MIREVSMVEAEESMTVKQNGGRCRKPSPATLARGEPMKTRQDTQNIEAESISSEVTPTSEAERASNDELRARRTRRPWHAPKFYVGSTISERNK
jgi:hypothetical protein